MMGYYDYVLALIPTLLVGVTGTLTLLGVPFEAAIPVGGVASALVIGHAVFINGPVVEDLPDAPAQQSGPGGRAGNAD
jgi:hypothetical protein